MATVTMSLMAYAQWPNLKADLAPWDIGGALKPTPAEVEELHEVVDAAADERSVQAHLAANPRLFSPLLGGGHGRWVRPKVRFSDRFEADFMIADADSVGIHWVYVELESPRAPMFLQNGEFAEKARHGIHQIHQWRDHVDRNGGEARRLRSEGGLGLPEVRPKGWGSFSSAAPKRAAPIRFSDAANWKRTSGSCCAVTTGWWIRSGRLPRMALGLTIPAALFRTAKLSSMSTLS
jgi:hypothetical protein